MRFKAMTILIITIVTLLACGRQNSIDEDQAIADATLTAENWLQLVDNGNFEASWEATSEIFKKDGDLPMWRANLENTYETYGRCRSRTMREALFKRRLPGGGQGYFVVIQYDSEFERKSDVRETVTPKLEEDGHWRVAGYILRASRTE
jgi:hypothetical protein